MADVFRKGRKSVHRAIISGDPDDPFSPAQCHLDGGGEWVHVLPSGPRCSVCFSGLAEDRAPARNTRPRTPALALASGALALAFLGGRWVSPMTRPVFDWRAFLLIVVPIALCWAFALSRLGDNP